MIRKGSVLVAHDTQWVPAHFCLQLQRSGSPLPRDPHFWAGGGGSHMIHAVAIREIQEQSVVLLGIPHKVHAV